MSDYICKGCKHNNYGWCKKLKKNKLTEIQGCEFLENENLKNFKIERTAKDYYGQQFVEIKINNESVSFPEIILKEFLADENIKSKEFEVNYER